MEQERTNGVGAACEPRASRARDLKERITGAASVYAVDRTSFYRGNLARAMRRAIAAGMRREQVIALSVLPRDEAESLLSGD